MLELEHQDGSIKHRAVVDRHKTGTRLAGSCKIQVLEPANSRHLFQFIQHVFRGANDVMRQIPGLGIARVAPIIEPLAAAGTELAIFYHFHQG